MALRTPAFNDAKSYGFEWLRAMLELGDVQEGVFNAGDLKVTAAAAGGQRVDIAAGVGLIKGDSGVPGTGLSQGLFMVVNDAAIANAVTLNASDVTNPRLDQIVLRVRDSSDLGSGADDALFEVVQGVATAGATLDNRNGAAALPNDRVRLADVLVPAGSSAVTAGNVRDRRPWARGAHRSRQRSAGDISTTVTVQGSAPDCDSVNLSPRIECSGATMRGFVSFGHYHSVANAGTGVFLDVDGAWFSGTIWANNSASAGVESHNGIAFEFSPTAGSHIMKLRFFSGTAGTATLRANGSVPLFLALAEEIRQDADNT